MLLSLLRIYNCFLAVNDYRGIKSAAVLNSALFQGVAVLISILKLIRMHEITLWGFRILRT